MSNVLITLGGVTFQDFEVPEKIVLGGAQQIAVHQLIGGGRVVDALGDAPGKISFAGIFSGADAASRAQLLDSATALGAQLPLFWESFFFTVVIERFEADYEKPWWIPFNICCVVVLDPAAAIAGALAPVADLISGDIASAAALAPQAGISLALPGTPTLAGLGAAQTAVAGGITSSGAALSGGATALAAATDAGSGAGALGQIVTASASLAAAANMSGYINRAAVNMANQMT